MKWTIMLGALFLLSACEQKPAPAVAQEFTKTTVCTLDGMSLADYPGPKGQIQYADGKTDFFCDTVEVLSMLLQPEQNRKVLAAFVNDMGKADWNAPRGNWIDARTAWFVKDSRKRGAMGATFVSFADEAAAKTFVAQQGGTILQFASIKPDMVVMDGGALHGGSSH
jgi:copper chaperone NosL